MKVSSEPSAAGFWQSSAAKPAASQQPSTVSTGPANADKASSAVIVDVRSTIQNMKPGRAYDLFGRSEAVDLSAAMPKNAPKLDMPVSKFLDMFSNGGSVEKAVSLYATRKPLKSE